MWSLFTSFKRKSPLPGKGTSFFLSRFLLIASDLDSFCPSPALHSSEFLRQSFTASCVYSLNVNFHYSNEFMWVVFHDLLCQFISKWYTLKHPFFLFFSNHSIFVLSETRYLPHTSPFRCLLATAFTPYIVSYIFFLFIYCLVG